MHPKIPTHCSMLVLSSRSQEMEDAPVMKKPAAKASRPWVGFAKVMWQWLKIKELGLRRFWSMFPLTRVPFWYWFFSHTHVVCPPLEQCIYLDRERHWTTLLLCPESSSIFCLGCSLVFLVSYVELRLC